MLILQESMAEAALMFNGNLTGKEKNVLYSRIVSRSPRNFPRV
jgi:hypothetical protein